jgi:hypothetical protein
MKAIDLWQNDDCTWTVRLFRQVFTGTWEACVAWLRAQGEWR